MAAQPGFKDKVQLWRNSIDECKTRHLQQEFLSFLRKIDKEVP
jgi:hypothetical protein